MNKPKRPILGVVAAEANNIEQRQILKGIIGQAQKFGYDTVIISNIYNPNEVNERLECENRIYELALSEDISAIIMISESFVNETLRLKVKDVIQQRDIPIIIVGTYLPEFESSQFFYINTSDESDIEEITDHLIDVHGFRSIDLLTGHKELEVSYKRVDGYKRSLIRHGIPVEEKRIHFGDFWMTSGIEIAEKYASGFLELPEAIVCANDYMAYGILDTFAQKGIKVPEQVTVVGYEYVNRRTYHTPLLTTYQRNRVELGVDAVKLIHNKLTIGESGEFDPPVGKMIYGESCPCERDNEVYLKELNDGKIKRDYEFWNLFSSLDQELTESKNLNDFVTTIGKFHWLLRDVYDIIICLSANWYDTQNVPSDIMTRRSVMPFTDNTPSEINRFDLAEICSGHNIPAAYYFTPLFFGSHLFGHIVLRYDIPDTYDDIFRNWIKYISISLEFLRMKNDIQYLVSCQNLSEERDTLTGMFNVKGIEKAYKTAKLHGENELYFIMLKVLHFDESVLKLDSSKRIDAVLDVSKAVEKFCGNHDVCGRTNEDVFVCIIQRSGGCDLLSDCLASILVQHRKYVEYCGSSSFVCVAEKCGDMTYSEIYDKCLQRADEELKKLSERHLISHYKEMSEIRDYVYLHPMETFETASLHDRFSGSTGYLRSVFKQCFGISFHKECIAARMAKAKYYLATTTMNVMDISERCGYIDSKYFLRQFSSITGMTPVQYRNLVKG